LIKKGVSLSILLLIAALSPCLPAQSVDPLNQHRTACCAFVALASQHVQVLNIVHNNIIKERKDRTERGKRGERKAVHKIITLFCLCMHFGEVEPQEVFGGPKVTVK